MDQHELVRKSVARISFKWPNNPHKKDKIVTVVIPGTIVSIKDDGSCVVIADPTFFREKNCPFVVNLPIAGGYDDVPVAPSMQFFVQGFCALVLQVQPNGYAQPVTFETRPVLTLDRVYAFMFQQNVSFHGNSLLPRIHRPWRRRPMEQAQYWYSFSFIWQFRITFIQSKWPSCRDFSYTHGGLVCELPTTNCV